MNNKILNIGKNLYYFLILSFVALELFIVSNLQWSLSKWKTELYRSENSLTKLQSAFLLPRIIDTVKGNEYFRDDRVFNVNYPDNYGFDPHAKNFMKYFKRYNGAIKPSTSKNDLKIVNFFYGNSVEAKKIFFSEKLNHNNIVSFVEDSKNYEKKSNFKAEILIEKYDGNNLELTIFTNNDGWLSFIDNWDPGWRATVNTRKVEIFKLLGSYKSIKVKKGFSKIRFQYKPW